MILDTNRGQVATDERSLRKTRVRKITRQATRVLAIPSYAHPHRWAAPPLPFASTARIPRCADLASATPGSRRSRLIARLERDSDTRAGLAQVLANTSRESSSTGVLHFAAAVVGG